MKVYLVTEGCYSDYSVRAVFSTEAKAQEMANLSYGGQVEPFEIDPALPAYPPGLKCWRIYMQRNGLVDYGFSRQESIELDATTQEEAAPLPRRAESQWKFKVWAKDLDHAVKIANERRIQMLASGEWETTWDEWTDKRK